MRSIVRLQNNYRGGHRQYINAVVVLETDNGEWKLNRCFRDPALEIPIKAFGLKPSEAEAYARKFQGMLYRIERQRGNDDCWEQTAVRLSDRKIEELSTLLLQESKVYTYDWGDRDDYHDAIKIWQEMKGRTDQNCKGAPINWWGVRDPDAPSLIRAYTKGHKSDNPVGSLANFLRVDIERAQELYSRYLAHVCYRV